MIKRLLGILSLLWRVKIHTQRFIMALFSFLFTLLLFVQVCARYIFNIPIFGIEEAAVYLAFWVYFIGAAYAGYERYHISASVVGLIFPEGKRKQFIEFIASFISFLVLVIVTKWCF